MDREIKFRQPIENSDGEFVQWHYWGFIDDSFIAPAGYGEFVQWHYWGFIYDSFIAPAGYGYSDKSTAEDSQQFTGLKDKNGQEIYEGDILGFVWEEIDEAGSTHWESIHEVIWGGIDYPAFDLKPNLYCEENSLSHLACSPEAPYFEVIGNKFENPELID